MASLILRIVVPRRKPHPQIPGVSENAAVKFMQSQIARCPTGADHLRSYADSIFDFLDLPHQESILAKLLEGVLSAFLAPAKPKIQPGMKALAFTIPANSVIPAISPRELKHRMHQVPNT